MISPRLRIRPGFTLIELLVVSAVFSLLFLIGATVFASIQGRQREILARQRLVSDGRYVLEAIARTVRLQRIDYAYYYTAPAPEGDPSFGPDFPTTILVTRSSTNEQTCYQHFDQTVRVGKNCGTTPTWSTLTPTDLRVTDFRVWIVPRSNPFLRPPQTAADCRAGTNPATFDASAGACDCTEGVVADIGECFGGQHCVAASSTPTFVCRNATVQPTVTIELGTESTGSGPAIRTMMQTTITSRVYGQ